MNYYISIGIYLLLFKLLSLKEMIILFCLGVSFLILEFKYPVNVGNFSLFGLIRLTVIMLFLAKGLKDYFPKKTT